MNKVKLLSLLLLVLSCKAQKKTLPALTKSADNNTLLWQVTGKGIKPTYIFGTMHLLCTEDATLSNNVKQIVNDVDKIYFELDMDDMGAMMGAMKNMGMKNGVTLKSLLTPEQYDKVKKHFEKTKTMLPFAMLENFKPLLTASTLAEEQMPCKKGVSGIEMQIMELNKKQKKEILGLETIDVQLAVFDTIPYKAQAEMLLQYMDSLATTKADNMKLATSYKKQNMAELEKLVTKSEPGLEKYMDVMLVNRNKNWLKSLKTIMKSNSVIAAVGAGHLVGKLGLIQLLKNEGYTLTPLKN